MNTFGKVIVAGLVATAVLQAVRPGIPATPETAELQAPPEVKRVLEKDCYSCHSEELRLSWFDQVVPAYWLVRHDILDARVHLDFSTLGSEPAAAQKAALFEAVNMMQLGAMPLPNFAKLHPEARVTPEDLATLKTYLAPWAPAENHFDTAAGSLGATSDTAPAPTNLANIQMEFNGLQFDSAFESWLLISMTDRGDNNTLRFILGNEIAVKAVRSGHISPWPDGSRLAKIAWKQEVGGDGLVHPGNFVQVELMVKDAQRCKGTKGWGWGRWRGLDLKPYGKDADFGNECTGCHEPVRGNDYVYTLPITAAEVSGDEVVNHRAAALPESLPYQPLDWEAITMYVNRNAHTIATLYGNDTAMRDVRASGRAVKSTTYSPGAVLALVTWVQRDDPHWFGARIPDAPRSVEYVRVAAPGHASDYRRFAGANLIEDHANGNDALERSSLILGLAPARLP